MEDGFDTFCLRLVVHYCYEKIFEQYFVFCKPTCMTRAMCFPSTIKKITNGLWAISTMYDAVLSQISVLVKVLKMENFVVILL